MNGVVVLRAVGAGTTDDPDEWSRGVDSLQIFGQFTLPTRPNHGKIAGPGARSALPNSRERIRPHIEQLQQVVATLCIWCRYDDRLFGQIEPAHGIEGVEVGMSGSAEGRGRKCPCVGERVHGPTS